MRKLLPGLAAVGVLAALVGIFYNGLLFRGLVVGDYDAFVYFYPLRDYAARVIGQGRFPLWNPYLFQGAPFFANVQTAVLYPLNALFLVLPTPYAFSASVVFHVLIAAVGMYLFGRRVLDVSRMPAVLGALSFTFSGFISWQVGHINQLSVSAWLPLLLVAFDEALRRRSIPMALGVGLIGTMQLLAGHTQEWYFSTVTLGLFALWRAVVPRSELLAGGKPWHLPVSPAMPIYERAGWVIRNPRVRRYLRPLGFLMLAGLVEIGVAAIQWMPTMELSGESIRGGGMPYGEAISFSLPPTSALYTLLPTYPSDLFSEYVGYVGMIPLLLAILSVLGWMRRPVTLFAAGAVVVGLFMAFGGYNPLAPYLFRWVPGLDYFRVPARWLLVYTFGTAALAALGAQLVLDLGSRGVPLRAASMARFRRVPFVAVSATGIGGAAALLCLLVLLARPAPTSTEALIWVALVVVGLGVAIMGLLGPRAARLAVGLLIAGAAAELWVAGGSAVARHPVPYEAFSPARTSTAYLLDALARSRAPERVLSVATDNYEVKETPDYQKQFRWLDPIALRQFMIDIKLSETLASNTSMEYGIQSPDGYDGGILPLRRYADLKSLVIPNEQAAPDSQLRINLPYVPSDNLLKLLNVKYVLGGKIKDAKVEGVYYDRGISVGLGAGESRTLSRMPDAQTTSIGVISSTKGAHSLGDGVVAGQIVVTDVSGRTFEFPLRLGAETAETAESDGDLGAPDHKRPKEVSNWPAGNKDTDYFVRLRLPDRTRVKEVALKGALPEGGLRVRAVTLIDDTAATSSPLVLSDDLDRELFFDMKVYTSRSAMPRAFVVYSSAVRDDSLALTALEAPDTRLNQTAILAPSASARSMFRSDKPEFQPGDARVVSYEAEKVVVAATARQDGYLVLMDAYFPGWTAEVDGAQVPIERANYLYRGVYLPRGEHAVVFRYEPRSFEAGKLVSVGSLVVIFGAVVGLGVRRSRRGRVL